jgi:hypothetical protein
MVARAASASPATQLERFIVKYDPAVAKMARECRRAMRKILPTANELVYDNYQFLAIGYCPNERPSDAIVSLAVSPKGVALCLIHGAKLPDPDGITNGEGKQTRFVRLASAKTLSERPVRKIIAVAIARHPLPLPKTGRGKLIIRAISAKQRPRRKVVR